MAAREVEEVAVVATNRLGYKDLKPLQRQVIVDIINGYAVFAVLQTGYGKTLCFASLPFVYDQVKPLAEPSIVIVLSPLIALMMDKVKYD